MAERNVPIFLILCLIQWTKILADVCYYNSGALMLYCGGRLECCDKESSQCCEKEDNTNIGLIVGLTVTLIIAIAVVVVVVICYCLKKKTTQGVVVAPHQQQQPGVTLISTQNTMQQQQMTMQPQPMMMQPAYGYAPMQPPQQQQQNVIVM